MTNYITNTTVRSNYNPSIWGPKAWFFLDTIILSYPQNPTTECKEQFKTFFMNIGKMLPCEGCRNNFDVHVRKNPLREDMLESRDKLINWWITIHNMSRFSMNKEQIRNIDFMKYYNESYNGNGQLDYTVKNVDIIKSNNSDTDVLNIIYIILLAILILFFKKLILNKKM